MPPAHHPAPPGLVVPATLLDASAVGIVHLQPVYAVDNPTRVIDLAYLHLNPAAQDFLQLPEFPAVSLLASTSPSATLFAFYRDTFYSEAVGYCDWPTPTSGGSPAWRVGAQRLGTQLVASFMPQPTALPLAPGTPADQPAADLFQRVVSQASAAICLLQGPEFRFEYVNPAFARLFAHRPLEGLPAIEGLPAPVHEGFMALLDRVYETGEAVLSAEVPLVITLPADQPSQLRYFTMTYQAHLQAGHPDRLSIFAHDVTEQVLARQLRAEQQTEWQRLFEQAPVAVAVLRGANCVVEVVNPAACALWNRSPTQLLGQPFFAVLPELASQEVPARVADVLATGTLYVAPALPLFRDQAGQLETVYCDLIFYPLREASGHIVGVTVVATDVSAQVAARQQVQHMRDVLQPGGEPPAVALPVTYHASDGLNQALQGLNAQLHAANQEYRTSNDELARTQQQLQQLNRELEARVAAGVAEARQARTSAERQQQNLERLLQQSPAAIAILSGPELTYELVNAQYQHFFPNQLLLGQPFREALPMLVSPAELRDVWASGTTTSRYKVPMTQPDAAKGLLQERYYDCAYQARQGEHGLVDGVLLFIIDVTEQVATQHRTDTLQAELLAAAQHQAQERETLYQVFAHTPALIAVLRGSEFRFEYINQAFKQALPGRAVLQQPVAEVLPELFMQGFLARIAQVYHTGEPFIGSEVPLYVEQADGQRPRKTFFNFTYQAYYENGQPAGVSLFAFDVTLQVQAKQQREAALAQLQMIFERAPVALALLRGPTYVVEVANPTICAYWSRDEAQVLNQPLLDALPEFISQGYPELLAEVWHTGQPFVAEEWPAQLVREGRFQTNYFDFVYQPLTDASGQVTAIVIVASDVSPRVLARQQLAQANETLRATNQQLTRTNVDLDNFIYTASHDLKTPIANIESLLLLLRKQLPVEVRRTAMVARVLEMMKGAVERFQDTIAQLTDLAYLQQVPPEPAEPVSLAAIVEAVRLDLAPQLEEASGQLTVALGTCTTTTLPAQHLRSVVYNLVSNALKYCHPDRRPEVQVRCYHTADQTVLEVQDNGLGLSPTQQAKLFGLFRRQHSHVAGAGVGLYIIKRIVENAGGTITVQSQLGVGSTFTVALPSG